jgi:hypothetical protein
MLPFSHDGGPLPVIVGLVPAAASWHVPAVLNHQRGNGYPQPAEHAAILRYWHDRHGADLVSLTRTFAEFSVGVPPRTRTGALALAWEFMAYNDGYYDLYGADNLTDQAAGLINTTVWLAWWD